MEHLAMQFRVFISYSRSDSELVTPLVAFLRVKDDSVFHDLDRIKPGTRWKVEIDRALTEATHLVLFWCHHSRVSAQVREEYELALQGDKAIVPVLLDSTPLPEALSSYQWIHFRQLVTGHHGGQSSSGAGKAGSSQSGSAGMGGSSQSGWEYRRDGTVQRFDSGPSASSSAPGDALEHMARDLTRAILDARPRNKGWDESSDTRSG